MLKKPYSLSLGIITLLFVPIFIGLGDLPFRIWDEGRIALNTYEMLESGDFINITYGGYPEFWNSKPILLHWIQGISITLFGFDEFSFRLPSAMAVFAVCLIVFYVGNKKFNSPLLGIIAAILLVSFSGFVGHHSGRTGEYDALLAFFTTLSTLYFYKSIEGSSKYLLHFWAFLTLAALTKGVGALLFLPLLGLFALWQKSVLKFLKSTEFYIGFGIFIVVIGGYYFGRELGQPGYLEAVYMNELGGRYREAVENHKGTLGFYFVTLKNNIHILHLFIFALTLYFGFTQKDPKRRRFFLFSFALFIYFALLLGSAATKLDWYFVPIYPFVALMIAMGIVEFLQRVIEPMQMQKRAFAIALKVCVFLFIAYPYGETIARNVDPPEQMKVPGRYGVSTYLQDCLHARKEFHSVSTLWDGYDAHIRIYVVLLQDQGNELRMYNVDDVTVGQKLLVSQPMTRAFLDKNFICKIEQVDEYTYIYNLLEHAD
ncbi:MAG: glycosyltransferase family 39 protein [Flavobacteriia bacterium]|nr:glycosyltransferase family 39 protein [Flavobacteriia bacterium]